MPDPLTLSVMSQIVRKAGGKDLQPETASEAQPIGQPHLTSSQAVLLSELIHKKKAAIGSAKPDKTSQHTNSVMSLDALVKNTKTR